MKVGVIGVRTVGVVDRGALKRGAHILKQRCATIERIQLGGHRGPVHVGCLVSRQCLRRRLGERARAGVGRLGRSGCA